MSESNNGTRTFTAVFFICRYPSSTFSLSSCFGILNIVTRSIGAIFPSSRLALDGDVKVESDDVEYRRVGGLVMDFAIPEKRTVLVEGLKRSVGIQKKIVTEQ